MTTSAPSAQAAGGTAHGELETAKQFLGVMQGYLEVSKQWMQHLEDPDMVVFLATEGIVEAYEEKGDKMGAVPELQDLLEKYGNNRVIRTAIRFKLRDLYKDSGQFDKALEELHAVLRSDAR